MDGPRKPRINSPCNGCGLCCVATPCAVAMELVPGSQPGTPCTALEWEDGRSWCGLVRRPFAYSHAVQENEITRACRAEGVLPDVTERIMGRLIGHDLGGVGGRCDSGPRAGIFSALLDTDAGKTAADYLKKPRGRP